MTQENEISHSTKVRKAKLTAQNIMVKQQSLLKKIEAKMQENNQSLRETASAIGISYSSLVGLRNGKYDVVKSDVTVEKLANYLEVPLVQIYIWGGFFKPIDFISKRSLQGSLNLAFDQMSNDPLMTTIAPTAMDWNNPRKWNVEAKLTVIRLYELFSNQLLLKHASADMHTDSGNFFLHTPE